MFGNIAMNITITINSKNVGVNVCFAACLSILRFMYMS